VPQRCRLSNHGHEIRGAAAGSASPPSSSGAPTDDKCGSGCSGALDDLTDDDQECDRERDAPERADQELTACRPPSALPAWLEDRHFGELALATAWVFAVGVALAYPSVPCVDEEFDLVPPSEFSRCLSRLSLRLVRRARSRAALGFDAPAVVAREHVDVAVGHRLDGAAAREEADEEHDQSNDKQQPQQIADEDSATSRGQDKQHDEQDQKKTHMPPPVCRRFDSRVLLPSRRGDLTSGAR